MSKIINTLDIAQGAVRGVRVKHTDDDNGAVHRVARLEIKDAEDSFRCVDITIPDDDDRREELAKALEKMARVTRSAPKPDDEEAGD